MSIAISNKVSIPYSEIVLTAIRAQGAGGQHVNKSSTAIHLRFDIKASSLPEFYKERLLAFEHHLITSDGIIVIKAQEYRSQEQNREEALSRLIKLIKLAVEPKKIRRATTPSNSQKRKRLENKIKRGETKSLRGKIDF